MNSTNKLFNKNPPIKWWYGIIDIKCDTRKGEEMDIYRHKEHTVYKLSKKIYFFKQHSKMMFWHKGKIVKNHRFSIRPHKQWCYFHWFIRQPYFYFERNNGGLYIGTPNKYFQLKK